MTRILTLALVLMSSGVLGAEQARRRTTLDIYVVDTEGGKATLFVTPSGESVLIDAGNPGGRDTDRILAVMADAGVTAIDHLVLTHYHVDHVGGLAELAARVPIAHYVDHGPTVETREQVSGFQATYADLHAKGTRTIVKPGDRLPVRDLEWRIVTAAGAAIRSPLAGAGARNAACADFQPRDASPMPDENAQSVGSLITFGQFRAIDLGDLLWNEEAALMCPANLVGAVDLYLVSHHGQSNSGSAALVHAVRPRAAVMQNGTRKGATPQALQIMRSSPGLEDVWQLHWSYTAGIEQNSAGVFVANLEDPATMAETLVQTPGQRGARGAGGGAAAHAPAHWIKISARTDGAFTVTNGRNQFAKTYAPRGR